MPTPVYVTDRIHKWAHGKAASQSVAQEGLVSMLLALALSNVAAVEQAVEMLKSYELGGSTDMQNRGW